ncbi:hypothetical protein C5612_04675 [Pseudomonas frederiksbergensis]|uniref:Uncharacterized protein n=1 Tax=Pseudomonas frederiksbergensis TaxID=104087 RepID=A0A2S8HUT4_9PSED|nr:hypothetical protein C5612_04675 [Pseudomonas frederiksbergensis]
MTGRFRVGCGRVCLFEVFNDSAEDQALVFRMGFAGAAGAGAQRLEVYSRSRHHQMGDDSSGKCWESWI